MIKKYNVTYSTVVSNCLHYFASKHVKATQLEAATYIVSKRACRLAQKTGNKIYATIYSVVNGNHFVLARLSVYPQLDKDTGEEDTLSKLSNK